MEMNGNMFETIISYFDVYRGPIIIYPDGKTAEKYRTLPRLMDVHRKGDFFIHYFDGAVSINYCFAVEDEEVRGGEHIFMISLVLKRDPRSVEVWTEIFGSLEKIRIRIKKMADTFVRRLLIRKLEGSCEMPLKSSEEVYAESLYSLLISAFRK